MPHSAVIARRSVDLLVPGGPSRRMSRPAATAASTRPSSRSRPTTRAWTRSLTVVSRSRPSRPVLIESCSFGSCSSNRVPGVDGELKAGHVPRLVRGEEQYRVADVARLDALDGQRVHEDGTDVRV